MFQSFLLPRGPRRQEPAHRVPRREPLAPHADELRRRVTVRLADADDLPALRHLAALDSTRLSEGTFLVGEMGGAIQAAVPLSGGRAIANPFVRTAELVTLLEVRARQLRELGVAEPDAGTVIPFPRRRLRLAGRTA